MLPSRVLACLVVSILAASCGTKPELLPTASAGPAAGDHAAGRPARWAEPIERPGLPNLHRVTPVLYRGAQPTAEGFRELARLGVKSVLSLRGFHDDDVPIEVGLAHERISFKAWHAEDEDVVRFLRYVSDPAHQPVFVHCQWGADRTGMMCAIERVAIEGWSKDAALEEMTQGGFGFHPEWQNLVRYVRELDVETLAREAGVRR